jgi:hypothetical protein
MAEDFYSRAFIEFYDALSRGDILAIRDSAEKAWNAVVQAVNALLLERTSRIPSSHFERRKMLREIEMKDSNIGKLGILDRYMARYKVLHGETFYEGIIDVEQLKTEIEKVKILIEDIKLLLSSTES